MQLDHLPLGPQMLRLSALGRQVHCHLPTQLQQPLPRFLAAAGRKLRSHLHLRLAVATLRLAVAGLKLAWQVLMAQQQQLQLHLL